MKLEEAITYAIMSDGHGKTTDQIAAAINRNGWEIGKSVAMPGGSSHTHVAVLCMEIDHLSGKEAIELVRAHK